MRVLLIEDNSAGRSIEFMLKSKSFTVHTMVLGEPGFDLGKRYDYDILVLDLNMRDMSGLEPLRSLRGGESKTPILILFSLGSIEDEVKGLGFGPGDYMIKPFHTDELAARMQVIARCSKDYAWPVINIGDLAINLEKKTVVVAGNRVYLTEKEYEVLKMLSLRKGTTLTKELFLNHIYGGLNEPIPKIIDVFVCKLRKKLANASNGKNYIETVWGRGYLLREPSDNDTQISTLPAVRMASTRKYY